MIYLKVIQSNIPKRAREPVTFEVEEGFLKSQLAEQGYVLIKKSDENNPVVPINIDDIGQTIKENISINKILGNE